MVSAGFGVTDNMEKRRASKIARSGLGIQLKNFEINPSYPTGITGHPSAKDQGHHITYKHYKKNELEKKQSNLKSGKQRISNIDEASLAD